MTTRSKGPNLYALLIGIDEYKSQALSTLRGCLNDVEAMRIFLTSQLDVPADHIRILTNQYATRTSILQTFVEFLIENPDIQRGDQILFHYSGYGSQMPDTTGTESNGLSEALVPYDSRTPGIYDIPSKTLAALMDQLTTAKGSQITVVLDCCHSSSGTRRVSGVDVARVRLAPVDNRIPPATLDTDLGVGTSILRDTGPSGWITQDISYVLLAACREQEEAYEYLSKDDEQNRAWFGALTYFTVQALGRIASNTTYAELHKQVSAQVHANYPSQTPQCEGAYDRAIFGEMLSQRNPFFITVQRVEGNTVILDAGLVHGLRLGTELALYPSNVSPLVDVPTTPFATAEVFAVSATAAQAYIPDSPVKSVPLKARGLIIKNVYADVRQTVVLQAADGGENKEAIDHLRQVIQQGHFDRMPSAYLQVVDNPDQGFDFFVVAAAGRLSIYNANGELLVAPEDIQVRGRDDVEAVRDALENIVRYRTILALTNEEPRSRLVGKVKLRLRRNAAEQPVSQSQDLLAAAVESWGEPRIYFDPDHKERNLYIVDVINTSSLPVYPHIFTLSPDYSIQRLYPRSGQLEMVRPGSTFSCPNLLQIYLPDGWDASWDYVKLIVTTVPSDLMMLEQAGLTARPPQLAKARPGASINPLEELLDVIQTSRHARPDVYVSGEWATYMMAVRTQRFLADRIVQLNEQSVRLYQRDQQEQAISVAGQAYDLAQLYLEEQHPTLAATLENLGDLYSKLGNFAEAEPLLLRALEIQRASLGEDHPAVANSLNALGDLYYEMGDYVAVEPLWLKAMEIIRAALGEEHPAFARGLVNLTKLYASTGRAAQALPLMGQVTAIEDRMIGLLSAFGTRSEGIRYLETVQENANLFLSLVLQQLSTSLTAVRAGLDLVLRRKVIGPETLALQREVVLEGRYPALVQKLRDLLILRAQIAQRALAGPDLQGLNVHRQTLMELNTRKELLEAELARQIPEINLSQKLLTADRWMVTRVLPGDAILVEFVHTALFDFQGIPSGGGDRWKPPHYVAFVLSSDEPDNVQIVDLGDAEQINQLIARFLVALTGTEGRDPRGDGAVQSQPIFSTPGMSTGHTLRKAIFDPLLPALGRSRYLVLCADGDLIQLPFAALPADDGSYLIDNYHFSYLQTGRDTLRFGVARSEESSKPLVVADPDFDLGGGRTPTGESAEVGLGLQPVYPSRGTRTFIRKPGTRTEGERISAMLGIRPWIGERALKVALSTVHSPRYLHLAVPGFFVTALQRDLKIEYLRPTSGSKIDSGSGQRVPLSLDEDLLLRSGLALSGANTWLQGRAVLPEAEDGLMTAETISSLDLSGTEFVVLSACEIGPVGGGISEIIAGFQRAFLLAGAKILVMNVWGAPDLQTSEFMENFYRHILDGRSVAAALRQTQLDMKTKWPNPFYWGAFICLGDLSPLPTLPTPISTFTKADDPYVVGLPAEGSAFVGRRDILAMIQDNLAPAAGKNILVLRGQRRSGKTSVLFRLRDTLPEEMHSAYLPVLIDMQGMAGVSSEGEFFFRMASEMWEDLSTHGFNVSRPQLSKFLQAPTSVFEFEFLDEVTRTLGNQRILLMIDEFDKIKDLIETRRLRSEMLDYFRHLMQHAPLLFLIAGTQRLREFTGGYWTVFFNLAIPVDIGTLNEAETRWLVTEPVRKWYTVETSAINEIVRVAGCHPYFTQLVCKKLLEVRNESRLSFLTMTHIEEAFNRALQSGDEQIGYPWTEKDCGDDERLILSVMASEDKGLGPLPITRIQQRLNETGLAADISIAVKRLEDRGVVRRENNDQLSFVVPLFQRWIASKHYDTLIGAVQYNVAARASGIGRGRFHA